MSDFLDNLKKAADNEEFNSEVAKKILDINELANSKMGAGTPADIERLKETLEKRQEKAVIEPISEEKAVEANTEYEVKMAQFKKLDAINNHLATLIEIEDMVKLSIADMMGHVEELKDKFKKEFEIKDLMFGDLSQKIKEIKSKYNF